MKGEDLQPSSEGARQPLLRLVRLTGGYRSVVAFEDVSLEVFSGEVVSLIGPNGAGKTALVKCVAGILTPFSGRIEWSKKASVGYLPQTVQLDRSLPLRVEEFLRLRLHPWSFRLFDVKDTSGGCRAALEAIGAAHLSGKCLKELSGGEFQRVLLASVLVKNPDLLLLDEPLSGVDPGGERDLARVVIHLCKQRGVAALLVSHDLHLVHHLSDRIYCLNRTLCCWGPPSFVLQEANLARVYGERALSLPPPALGLLGKG
jgi:zinc transport system ATP-binding protein